MGTIIVRLPSIGALILTGRHNQFACRLEIPADVAPDATIHPLQTPHATGVDALARQLRSKVRKEFWGVPTSAREVAKMKEASSAMARYTSRESMIVERPFSAITGSIRTNVPMPRAGRRSVLTTRACPTEERVLVGARTTQNHGKGSMW